MNLTSRERWDKAVRAAVAVAIRLGMPAVAPVVLKDSTHTSIHLSPSSVVARVVPSTDAPDVVQRLRRELDVARYLEQAGAPIVGPSKEVPPGPYFDDDAALTLWQFVSHRPACESDVASAVAALRLSHEALVNYPGELPPFNAAVDACYALLKDEAALAPLAPTDRTFLLSEHGRLRARLAGTAAPSVVLHGDPHLGNVLMTADGPRWTDWESVCTGPLEWDLSCLPETALPASCGVDRDVLATLRDLRSLCVSVWCWAHFEDRKSTRLNSSHSRASRMPSSA